MYRSKSHKKNHPRSNHVVVQAESTSIIADGFFSLGLQWCLFPLMVKKKKKKKQSSACFSCCLIKSKRQCRNHQWSMLERVASSTICNYWSKQHLRFKIGYGIWIDHVNWYFTIMGESLKVAITVGSG